MCRLQVNVSVSEIDSSRAYHGWFQLSPRPQDSQAVLQDRVELGTMRLSVLYSQDSIFPLEVYKPLQSLLLQTLEVLVSMRVKVHIDKKSCDWCFIPCSLL